jgi:SAM-dependent methyltransferase
MASDTWASGASYESYIGRWSRPVARSFLHWLGIPSGARWLDVGCGTGALTQTILDAAAPSSVMGVDPSEGFLLYARELVTDDRARFQLGGAEQLPAASSSFDVAVAGLVLNFVPDPRSAVSEMARVTKPDGTVAVYVWDYARKMQLLRVFWDAAVELDPGAAELDEGRRFPIAQRKALTALFTQSSLRGVSARAIDVRTVFRDFDDYWEPFLGGQGPAGAYAASLNSEQQAALRELIRARLPMASDGSTSLVARAWAVRGQK